MVNKLTLQHKRSSVAGNKPTAAQIAIGELAVNFADKKLYTKDASGVVIEIPNVTHPIDYQVKATAPTLRSDGVTVLAEGDVYYNTATDLLYTYNGTIWTAVGGSKWTDVGTGNIYRNSKVAIGSTTDPTTALYVTGDTTVTANLVVDTSTFVVDSVNNRVGVGTATPTVALDVVGDGKVSANLVVDTDSLVVDATNNRVGIGTITPAARLDVVAGSAAHTVVAMPANDMNLATGQIFTKTFVAGLVTLTFSNVPASRGVTVVLHTTNAGLASITWPTGTKWPSGTSPTLTSAGIDVVTFTTHDGGTTWRANVFGKDIK